MPTKINLLGSRFGRLLVLKEATERRGHGSICWECICDCGTIKIISSNVLRRNHALSCGCLQKEIATNIGHTNKKHGLTRSRTYKSWSKMKERCIKNPKSRWFKWYKNIIICEGFKDFILFYKVMGLRPKNKTLDRIDSNKNYTCGECRQCKKNNWELNCRWANSHIQRINRKKNNFNYSGENKIITRISTPLKLNN